MSKHGPGEEALPEALQGKLRQHNEKVKRWIHVGFVGGDKYGLQS